MSCTAVGMANRLNPAHSAQVGRMLSYDFPSFAIGIVTTVVRLVGQPITGLLNDNIYKLEVLAGYPGLANKLYNSMLALFAPNSTRRSLVTCLIIKLMISDKVSLIY